MNKTLNSFNLIQKISIFLIIISIGIFIFISFKNKLFSSQKQSTNIQTSDSISQQEYSTWKIFNNSEMKYSLKYPQDWILDQKSSTEIYLYSPSRFQIKSTKANPIASNIFIKIYNSTSDLPENSKNLDLNNWIKLQSSEENIKNITLNGVVGYEILTSYPTRIIFLQKDSLIYSIFDSSADNSSIQKQIINSLEFN